MSKPEVWDVRPQGHASEAVLPRLGTGDFDRLQEFYKFEIDTRYGADRAEPGQKYWEIVAFELKAGPAILQPQVRDENGNLILTPPGILMFLNWPGTSPFASPVDPPYFQNGVAGFTEGKGNIGWGFGGSSHIGPDGGPFTVWASSDPADWTDRRVGSNAVTKLGWWDDHIIPNPIFQTVRKAGGQPPPTGGVKLVNMDANGNVIGYLDWIPGAPPVGEKKGGIGLMVNGQVTHYMTWR